MKTKRIRYTCFFLVIFAHISVLNLFYVNEHGITFFWQQAVELRTIATHVITAALSLLIYALVEQCLACYRKGQMAIREPVLILCSISMILSIGFLLID
ncbi:hypothetical protein [Thalassotalea euphylliae]|uniref:hypothetical protein n=1 Tax=Thalassotalea euphylliae TaxID=1655234 RepID=UPI0011C0334F|nr:hypothetical protein [Thalassotalea euphylliae]